MLMSGGFSTQAEGNSLLGSQALDKDWLLVPQGEERQFLFEERDKIRHKVGGGLGATGTYLLEY